MAPNFIQCESKLSPKKNKPKPKELIADRAYEDLKWKILNGEVATGILHTENSICELLNVGRSPVRQALTRLQHDRLIDVIPRKGMLIRGITSRELNELASARIAVESLVVQLAVENASDEDIKALEKLLKEAEHAEYKKAMRIDHEFHIKLAECSGNSVLVELVSFMKKRSSILWFRSVVTKEKMKEVLKEHRAVVKAIKNRDKRAAVAAIKLHVGLLTEVMV